MSDETLLRMIKWVLLFALVLVLFVFFMQPLAGVLVALIVYVSFRFYFSSHPHSVQLIRESWAGRLNRIKRVFRKPKPTPDSAPPYYLVGINTPSPINYRINQDEVVVGRDKRCDIVINNPGISGRHFRIRYLSHSKTYKIEDLGSKNGTYVSTTVLKAHTPILLSDESKIVVNDLSIRFTRNPGQRSAPPNEDNHVDKAGWTKPPEQGIQASFRIRFKGSERFETCMVDSNFVIGRDSAASLRLSEEDAQAGRKHAMLLARSGQIRIVDLNSLNGTFVNNERIYAGASGDGRVLMGGDVIRIGSHSMTIMY